MTQDEQVQAVVPFGFTRRQAGFLVEVMRHAGVCLARQYCTYAGIVRGQKTHDFFGGLVARRYATAHRGGVGDRFFRELVGMTDRANVRMTVVAGQPAHGAAA